MCLLRIFCTFLTLLAAPVQAEAWQRYTTSTFSLSTNADPTTAQLLLQDIERFDQVTRHYIADTQVTDTPPLHIIVFRTRREFAKVVNQRHFAAYTRPDISTTNLVIGPDAKGELNENVFHEYVHYRLRTQAHAYPTWYEEGLATLLSAVEWTQQGARVGHRIPEAFRGTSYTGDLKKLVAQNQLTHLSMAQLKNFYAHSTYLVQYLHFNHKRQPPGTDLTEQLHQYIEHRNEDFFTAINQPAKDLAKAVRQFQAIRDKPADLIPVNVADISYGRQILAEQAVLELHAEVARMTNPRRARKLLKRLTQLSPDEPRHWVALTDVLIDTKIDDLAGAKAAHQQAREIDPEHPDVLIYGAVLQTKACPLTKTLECHATWRQTTTPLRQALQKNPQHFQAILWLGIVELYTGNPGGAINYLRIAHQRAPWSAFVNYLMGECLRLLGNPRAETYLNRALAWSTDTTSTQLANASLALLRSGKS